jgi:hypothetical protein
MRLAPRRLSPAELALGREPDAPGLGVMRKFGFSGACGLDAGLRIMTHEHNGEEPSSDQSDKCHKAKKVLHDHPPFLMKIVRRSNWSGAGSGDGYDFRCRGKW